MFTHQLILGVGVLVSMLMVLIGFGFGAEMVTVAVSVNLLLIGMFGAKLISIFGFISNIGNIFYATTFFAVQLLLERYGRREAVRAIWAGVFSLALFVVMGQIALNLGEIVVSSDVDKAIATVFQGGVRLGVAIGLPFLIAQHIQIAIFEALKRSTGRRLLWVRSIAATVGGQLVDSILFFSIAFAGILPDQLVFQMMVVGFLAKTGFGLLSIPLLYASRTVYHT